MVSMLAKVHDYINTSSSNGNNTQEAMPKSAHRGFFRYFMPHEEVQVISQQSSKGLFLPWPLLTIIITLAIVVISGLIALEVQVSNLNTTLLLRDSDQRAEITALKEKQAQLEVYIHNDREKLIDIQTTLRESEKRNNDARRH